MAIKMNFWQGFGIGFFAGFIGVILFLAILGYLQVEWMKG